MENVEEQEETKCDNNGYDFRESTKRRRLENENKLNNDYHWWHGYKRKNPINYMPTEVLQKIFSFISYNDLGNYKLLLDFLK